MRWQFKYTPNELNPQHLHLKNEPIDNSQQFQDFLKFAFYLKFQSILSCFIVPFLCFSALMGLSLCGSLFILSPESSPWFHFVQPVY